MGSYPVNQNERDLVLMGVVISKISDCMLTGGNVGLMAELVCLFSAGLTTSGRPAGTKGLR